MTEVQPAWPKNSPLSGRRRASELDDHHRLRPREKGCLPAVPGSADLAERGDMRAVDDAIRGTAGDGDVVVGLSGAFGGPRMRAC
jgi:hypothetical protein